MSAVPNCPFCLDNHLLKGEVLSETPNAFLIEAYGSASNFLIIPKQHTEDPSDLPDTWWSDFTQLFAHIPSPKENYNLSLNVGATAGQTVKHLHFWIIPRKADNPSSGKGLAGLISIVDAQG